jgi:hypothetical protein
MTWVARVSAGGRLGHMSRPDLTEIAAPLP